jgi:uncharacterized ferritin-like protein (DUF455 family)
MHASGNVPLTDELRTLALDLLVCQDASEKMAGAAGVQARWQAGSLTLEASRVLPEPKDLPGRPAAPELVPPAAVPRRAMNTNEGRAALLHALAHIEFNAINLALDAIWRFPDMPQDYYSDWLRVAAEEAYHFGLLSAHLQGLGYRYGDFSAHNGLWDAAEKTKKDVLARMALVPRTLEARGLDASPAVKKKLEQVGDRKGADILEIILRDEIGHVAIGNRWYAYLCAQASLDPVTIYPLLAKRYDAPALRGPFNLEARRQAGFSEEELLALKEAAKP